MMRSIVLLLLLMASTIAAPAQADADSMRKWLDSIDNNCVIMVREPSLHIGLNDRAQNMLNHLNAAAFNKLYEYLDSSNRVLVAHVLLTKALAAQSQRLYHTTQDRTEKIVVDYSFNEFHWQEYFDKTGLYTELKMDSAEMSRIKVYWKAKLNGTPEKP